MLRLREIVDFLEFIKTKTKNLEKVFHLSKFLKKVPLEDIDYVILFLQGRIFPEYEEKVVGISGQLIIKTLSKITGISVRNIENEFKELGDLGEVTEKLLSTSKQQSLLTLMNAKKEITIKYLYDVLYKISQLEGSGAIDQKISYLLDLLINSTPLEAKYVVKLLLDNLRVGIGFGMLRDAVVYAYMPKIVGNTDGSWKKCTKCNEIVPDYEYCVNCGNKHITPIFTNVFFEDVDIEDLLQYDLLNSRNARNAINSMIDLIESKYDLTNDLSEIIKALHKGMKTLLSIKLELFKPVRAMLYVKVDSVKEAFEVVGKPAALEYKYDGFRIQGHVNNSEVKLYTRNLEDVTKQFPELVSELLHFNRSLIFDGEAVAIDPKTGRAKPFQEISQRIRRKYNIPEMAKKFPVKYEIFDILLFDNQDLLKTPFKERRKILENLFNEVTKNKHFNHIHLATQIITDDENEAKEFFKESIANGNEGLMIKSLNAPYKPGKRVGYGVKLKTILDPLDLVVVGAEWGEGKRSKWLTSYSVACLNPYTNELLTIGKVSTGVKEKDAELTYELITQLLKPLIIEEQGKFVKVKPELVLEVGYEEIQKSPSYDSGYALRFPRVIRIRDKPLEEIATIEDIERIYMLQRGRSKSEKNEVNQ